MPRKRLEEKGNDRKTNVESTISAAQKNQEPNKPEEATRASEPIELFKFQERYKRITNAHGRIRLQNGLEISAVIPPKPVNEKVK